MSTELLRIGLGDKPMPIGKLKTLLAAVDANDADTIRHRNGNLLVERDEERTSAG